ncbi:MAG: hypothetical protein PVI30_21450 [Myxococcales bacterium]
MLDGQSKRLDDDDEILEEICLVADGSRWRVLVYRHEHAHRFRVERDGRVEVEHEGSLPGPADFPGPAYPVEVQRAVDLLNENLSFG